MLMEFVVLLMPYCSRECSIQQDYDSIEAKYFKRNSRVQWSEWHEWWYNDRGERIDPDRWRLWKMWEEHQCSAYTARLRAAPWVQTLLSKMNCPPRRFDVFSAPVPASSVLSSGLHHKKTPQIKKDPVPSSWPTGSDPGWKRHQQSRHRAQAVP